MIGAALNTLQKIFSLVNVNEQNFSNVNGDINLKTKINFNLDKHFRVKNLLYSTEGDINYLESVTKERRIVKKYLPNYNGKIIIKDARIKGNSLKPETTIDLQGLIKLEEDFDNLKFKQIYNSDKKIFKISGGLGLSNSNVNIPRINFYKINGKKAEVIFDLNLFKINIIT